MTRRAVALPALLAKVAYMRHLRWADTEFEQLLGALTNHQADRRLAEVGDVHRPK